MPERKKTREVRRIIDKLKTGYGKTPEDASREELYQASAACIRDEIMELWVQANHKIEAEGRKILY